PGADDAALPGLTLGLCAHRAQVAAHAQGKADQAPRLGGLADLLDRVALAHAAHVQAHLGVGQVDGAGLPVNDEVVDVAVLGGGFQFFLGGQAVVLVGGVGLGGLPVVVPDGEDAAHGDVQFAAGGVVHFDGQFEHINDPLVHLDRRDAGVVVDGFDVVDALVIVVNIVEPVVGDQIVVEGLHLLVELGLAVAVGDGLGHGVEHVEIVGGEPLGAVADGGFGLAAAAGQQSQA